eukprot:12240140-Ditylum_brightwellii.AAC.1
MRNTTTTTLDIYPFPTTGEEDGDGSLSSATPHEIEEGGNTERSYIPPTLFQKASFTEASSSESQSVTSASQSVTSISSKSKLGLMKRLSISVSQTAANALPSTRKRLTSSSSSLPTLHGGDASMASSA